MKVPVSSSEPRGYTCALLELVEDGIVDKDWLIKNLLDWMSEYEVKDFCNHNLRDDETNEPLIGLDEEEDEDDFNYVGSKEHY